MADSTANRLDRCFSGLNGRAALILYVTAGHPDISSSARVAGVVAECSDVIEIGIPFSDPVADGPAVQASTQMALSKGATMDTCFQVAKSVRQESDKPIVFLTYYNPVLRHGLERFADESAAAGVDGFICPDLPAEEAGPIRSALAARGLHLVPMVAPTSTKARLESACAGAGGFIYCVSRTGVTGARDVLNSDLPAFLERVRSHTRLPRGVGFGVSTPEQAASVSKLAEGVIIGSALVSLISNTPRGDLEPAIRRFASGIREGMDATG